MIKSFSQKAFGESEIQSRRKKIVRDLIDLLNAKSRVKIDLSSAQSILVNSNLTNNINSKQIESCFKKFYNYLAQCNKDNYIYLALSICCSEGIGVDKNDKLANTYLNKIDENDSEEILQKFGTFLMKIVKNYKLAFYCFDKIDKDEKKASSSSYFLALLYYFGKGVDQNYAKARELFERVITNKSNSDAGSAYKFLGEIYWKGLGVQKNKVKAHKFLLESIKYSEIQKNINNSYYMLGRFYAKTRTDDTTNKSIIKNDKLAFKYYNKYYSITKSLLVAPLLAECYFYGLGVNKNYKLAFTLSEKFVNKFKDKAGIQKHGKKALFILGSFYELSDPAFNKIVKDKDYLKASTYYNQAFAAGCEKSFEAIKNLHKKVYTSDVKDLFRIYLNDNDILSFTNGCNLIKNIVEFDNFKDDQLDVVDKKKCSFTMNSLKRQLPDYSKFINFLKNIIQENDENDENYDDMEQIPCLLGQLYEKGWIVNKDLNESCKYYEKGAEFKSGESILKLVDCYSKGLGCKKNIDIAIRYGYYLIKEGYETFMPEAVDKLYLIYSNLIDSDQLKDSKYSDYHKIFESEAISSWWYWDNAGVEDPLKLPLAYFINLHHRTNNYNKILTLFEKLTSIKQEIQIVKLLYELYKKVNRVKRKNNKNSPNNMDINMVFPDFSQLFLDMIVRIKSNCAIAQSLLCLAKIYRNRGEKKNFISSLTLAYKSGAKREGLIGRNFRIPDIFRAYCLFRIKNTSHALNLISDRIKNMRKNVEEKVSAANGNNVNNVNVNNVNVNNVNVNIVKEIQDRAYFLNNMKRKLLGTKVRW